MRRFVVLLPFMIVAVLATSVVPVAAQDTVLQAPVEAEVLDPFRLPDGPYGPGNRGIEYDTEAGVRVRAAGPGIVVFAGSVAGAVYVSVEHGDGLRTSYGPVGGLRVGVGDTVDRGEWLASTVGPVHFSARVHGEYVDPATLFGVRRIEVRLVDHTRDDIAAFAAAAQHGERQAIYDLIQHQGDGGGGLFGRIMGWADALGGLVDPASTLAGLVAHAEALVAIGGELSTVELGRRLIAGLASIVDPAPCSEQAAVAAASAPVGRRIAVVIDGLSSSTTDPGIRDELGLDEAGYLGDDVVRFSYAGGLAPGGGHGWADDIPRSTYDAAATTSSIEGHIAEFGELLRQVRAANPGVPIDVYGHSLGGVVARHAIAEVDAEVGVSVAVTLASPHRGAPSATLADAVMNTGAGTVVGGVLEAEGSDNQLLTPIVSDLSQAGFAGDNADVAFPDSVHAVTIGARADIWTPANMADAPGGDHHVVVGDLSPIGAHSAVAGLPEVHDEIRLALAGMAPACTGARDRVLDLVVPEAIAAAEQAATIAIIAADATPGGGGR